MCCDLFVAIQEQVLYWCERATDAVPMSSSLVGRARMRSGEDAVPMSSSLVGRARMRSGEDAG